MLGSKTKQVASYGRRGRRIVNVSEEQEKFSTPLEHDSMSQLSISARSTGLADKSNSPGIRSPSPQIKRKRKPIPRIVSPETTPEPSEKVQRSISISMKAKRSPKVTKSSKADSRIPSRQPLSSVRTNTPKSSASIPNDRKKKLKVAHRQSLLPVSPAVDMDIVVLDAQGRRVSQERRVSRSNVQVNPLAAVSVAQKGGKSTRGAVTVLGSSIKDNDNSCPPKPIRQVTAASSSKAMTKKNITEPTIQQIFTLSDSDDEVLQPKPPRNEARPAITSDDKNTEDRAAPPLKVKHLLPPSTKPRYFGDLENGRKPTSNTLVPQNRGNKVLVAQTTPRAPRPRPSATHALLSPEICIAGASRPRQLTPLRGRSAAFFPAPPSPPSPTTSTDFDDFTFDLSNLNLSPAAVEQGMHGSAPASLLPLLQECEQSTLHEFSAFIDMFPFDPIVRASGEGPTGFQKIGEASYSEVFGIGDVVLKVIPLQDEDNPRVSSWGSEDNPDSPFTSLPKDVLKEMVVTRAMGETCDGFVRLLRSYIVRGRYPSLLLQLWDEYNEKKGSESVRPDSFAVSQIYAIIVLPNGGPDLETYVFSSPTKSGWRQACGIFWQVVRTLADAEDLVCFEHRDLHWGQILVKNIPSRMPRVPSGRKLPMDDLAHGIETTIIDLGLSRMDSNDDGDEQVHWTPFEDEIFEGEGDYQFDVYRMMKKHSKGLWHAYHPLTNVMWLHYLAVKLLNAKRLRPPSVSKKSVTTATTTYTEEECYQCLVEMETMLKHSVDVASPGRKGKRKTQALPLKGTALQTAGDVLQLAIAREWVR